VTALAGFALRKPCGDCPFRADKPFHLTPERAKQFADDLANGSGFNCHKTVEFGDTEAGEPVQIVRENTNWCAGALITLEKSGLSNQQVRIAQRLGAYDPTRLDMDAPVYPSLSAWVASYRDETEVRTVEVDGDVLEFEHCGVVGSDCEDPAGYMSRGGAMANADPGTCNPVEDECQFCGLLACSACTALTSPHGPVCVDCAEDEDDE
jgi:hypothetical protein